MIAGVASGLIFLVLLALFIIIILFKRKKRREQEDSEDLDNLEQVQKKRNTQFRPVFAPGRALMQSASEYTYEEEYEEIEVEEEDYTEA